MPPPASSNLVFNNGCFVVSCDMKCEYCEVEHDGAYGSGRFCSAVCARGFSTASKRLEINAKVGQTLRKHPPQVKQAKLFLTSEEKRLRNVQNVLRNREMKRTKALLYKGGCCVICGYNRCKAALAFHHFDPNQKEDKIIRAGFTIKWDRIQKELDKCILLCVRCHAEVHAGLHPEFLISLAPSVNGSTAGC